MVEICVNIKVAKWMAKFLNIVRKNCTRFDLQLYSTFHCIDSLSYEHMDTHQSCVVNYYEV